MKIYLMKIKLTSLAKINSVNSLHELQRCSKKQIEVLFYLMLKGFL